MVECVKDYIVKSKLDIKLVKYSEKPDEILQFVKENRMNGLYFLDIELDNGDNGVLLGKSISQYDPSGYVVFVTSYEKYMPSTLDHHIQPFGYIIKNDDETVCRKIGDCIFGAYQKHIERSKGGSYIFKMQNGRETSCEYRKILFFEKDKLTTSQRIILHTESRQYVFYGTLNKVLEELPSNIFFRCHKSYIVNLENLTENCKMQLAQGHNNIVMSDGNECSVSSRNSKLLLKLLDVTSPVKKPN